MAFINFNKSTIFNEAIKNSVVSQNTLYFPPDSAAIIKNGKVYGIASCGTSLSFDSSTGILSHTASGVTSGNYGPSSDVTGTFNGSFEVPYITINTFGHITNASNKKITIPALAHSHATYTNVTAHAHAHSHNYASASHTHATYTNVTAHAHSHTHATYTNVTAHAHAHAHSHSHSGYLTNVTSHTHAHSHNYADTAGSAQTAYSAEWSNNALEAQKWENSATIKIGNKTHTINANYDIDFTLADIGAATTGHSHSGYATTGHSHSTYTNVTGHTHATYTNVTAHAHSHSHSGYLTSVTAHAHSHTHATYTNVTAHTHATYTNVTAHAHSHTHATYTNVTAHAHAHAHSHSHSGYLTNVTSHTHAHSHNYADTAGSAQTAYSAEWSDNTLEAQKWQNSATIKIGNKTHTINADYDIDFTLADIGAATTGHYHSGYLTSVTAHAHSHSHNYASTSHSHSGYAGTGHSHSAYATTSYLTSLYQKVNQIYSYLGL